MSDESGRKEVAGIMQRINRAWLDRRIEEMEPFIHQDIVMVFPGFSARVTGRENFLAGFRDFADHAVVQDLKEQEYQIDVAGETAVVNFRFEMLYERSEQEYRSTGRDFWVFHRSGGKWLAVWRTMLEVEESEV